MRIQPTSERRQTQSAPMRDSPARSTLRPAQTPEFRNRHRTRTAHWEAPFQAVGDRRKEMLSKEEPFFLYV